MVMVEKTKFVFSLAGMCADLMDWQDFTLTLIDGDVLEGAQDMGPQPWYFVLKGSQSWNLLLAWSVISFLAITFGLVYEFAHAIAKVQS